MRKRIGIIAICFLATVFILLASLEKIIFSYQRDGGLRHASRYYEASSGKEIIFIPMTHLNSREFNVELRNFLEQKKKEGFVVFREGVLPSFHTIDTSLFLSTTEAKDRYGLSPSMKEDSLSTITVLYKQRKILNSSANWSNPEAGSSLKSFYKDSSLVHFPFIDGYSDKEIWVDYTTGDLVRLYEKKYGEVELSEYDYSIPTDAPYEREQSDTTFYSVSGYASYAREDLLQAKLLASPWKKIVVVYGAAHIAQLKIFFDSDKTDYVKDKKFSAK